jgi:hypothetical protein
MRTAIRTITSLLLLVALFAIRPVAAQSQSQSQDDPPGRVGRLNYTEGSVSYQLQGDQDWVAADPNRPLTTGDNLWADDNSRGEVHIDSTAIRMSADTGLSFLSLDDRTVQLELPQGTIEVHLRQLAPGDAFEIDTPNLAFTPTRAGEYVISTDPNGSSTTIIVREGEGEVTGGGDSWDVASGQQYSFNGTDQLNYNAQPSPDYNDFEAWCQTRDQRENNSVSAQYVSRDVDGYYDLDSYGDWSEEPDYGAVWYPRGVAVDWVPYHVGHWVYIAPWGWTWVDEEPWGFAPFHYGRWVEVGTRWGWVPGPVVRRPVYAPALVGFVGGAGFGLSVSIGGGFTGVAWFPLGPRDVFVPGYHCSPHYVQVVNVTNTRVVNVTQVTNVYNAVIINHDTTHVQYTYAGNAHAVTAVTRDTFVNARPVAKESVHINDTQIKDVRVVSNAAISPTRGSYISATAKVSSARPAVPFANRPVVANLTPRVPIQTQRPPATNNGFRSFAPNNGGNAGGTAGGNVGGNAAAGNGRGNGINASSNASNSGPNSGPRNVQAQPQATHAPSVTNTQPNNAPTNSGPANNTPPRTLEEQGTPRPPANSNTQPNSNQPPSNNGFRSFGAPNSGNGSNSGTNDNHTQPQVQQNNQTNNNDRYRFSPPVKAKDDNYDVHPPLNQNNNSNSQPPKSESQPSRPPQQHDAPPPKNSNNNSSDKNNNKH